MTKLRAGDFLFLGSSETTLSSAISQVARGWDGLPLTHVGIVDANGRVWEASPEEGVRSVRTEEFLSPGAISARGRLVSKRHLIHRALEWIRAQAGRPYNPGFHVESEGLYCSQMIVLAFEHAGGKPLFPQSSLNFVDETGKIPEFWIEWYRRRGEAVPQGQPGSHPATLSLSPLLSMAYHSWSLG